MYAIDELIEQINLADSLLLSKSAPLADYLLALNISLVCQEQLSKLGIKI